MSAISKGFYDTMANDSTLTDLLTVFNGEPAIFTTIPVPAGATLPWIITEGEVSVIPDDTKNSEGREIIRDIRCYDHAGGSAVRVETIAERVRYLFHHQTIAIAGFDNPISIVTGPTTFDEDDTYGRIVTVRLNLQET